MTKVDEIPTSVPLTAVLPETAVEGPPFQGPKPSGAQPQILST